MVVDSDLAHTEEDHGCRHRPRKLEPLLPLCCSVCRKCIYEKLSNEGMSCCPVCNINLGSFPIKKLRPDHSLQSLREKVFPFEKENSKALKASSSVRLPSKGKEISLSSLVASAPKVSMQASVTGKRTKTRTRKVVAIRGCDFIHEGSITKKEETNAEDNTDSSMAKHKSNEAIEHNVELTEGMFDLRTQLSGLVVDANRTSSSRTNSQATPLAKLNSPITPCGGLVDTPKITTKSDRPESVQRELNIPKSKNSDIGPNILSGDDKDANILPSRPANQRRLHSAGQKRVATAEMPVSAPVMLDAMGSKPNRKHSDVWFSLVASEDWKGDVTLPQVSARYIRNLDGTAPVSSIQKYLAKKLNLASEAEVEIMCRGQPVPPSLQLHNLVEQWFRTPSTSEKVPAPTRSSPKDFVMVLSYCRKAWHP